MRTLGGARQGKVLAIMRSGRNAAALCLAGLGRARLDKSWQDSATQDKENK